MMMLKQSHGALVLAVATHLLGPASGLVGQDPQGDTVVAHSGLLALDVVADGFALPVSMTFLGHDEALVADRAPAALYHVDLRHGTRQLVRDLPTVFAEGDGGLLDVARGPNHEVDGWIYLAYTDLVAGDPVTVLDRVRLSGPSGSTPPGASTVIGERERLFAATRSRGDTVHYGGRIAFDEEHVFLTLGERYELPEAQSLASYNGTIVRLRLDGSIPSDNPFPNDPDVRPEVWSYGHRNPQGLVFDSATGTLWSNEHGPQGGDELNRVEPGRNYGWPIVTYGEEYGGGPIGEGIVRGPGFEEPIYYWRPSIGPSDMVIHSGVGMREWGGNLFVGAMAGTYLSRLVVVDGRVLNEERLLQGREWRIRMVEEGPDGSVYVGTDSGLLVRLRPMG